MGAFSELSCGIVDPSDGGAVPATETAVCARDRTNSRLPIPLSERSGTARRDLRYLTPVVEYIDPDPAVYTVPAPVHEYVASVHADEYVASAPPIEYMAPTPAVTVLVPAEKTLSLRDIARRSSCEQRESYQFLSFSAVGIGENF